MCVCGAADRTCSSLPRHEQILEYTGTWELLNSCLIRGAHASLNTEICLCRGYLQTCLLTSFFFSCKSYMPFPMAILNPYGKWVSEERGEEGVRLAEHPLPIYLFCCFGFVWLFFKSLS